MKLNYKTYWRKTGLKGKWGNIYLERIFHHKPKNFLEIGVFCGVTARNTCDFLKEINGESFYYIGIDLFGGEKNNSIDEIEPKFLLNQKFSNPNYDINRKGRNATHQFTQFLGVKGYPTMVFLSENGAPIMPVVGYQKPKQLELFLKMIKQGDYQIFSKPEDFENYKKSLFSNNLFISIITSNVCNLNCIYC